MADEPTRVLLVEDDPAHAELVRRAFEARGSQVQLRVAETLAEARTCLAEAARLPQIVISDWRLPDGEGMELLTDERLANAPVIIMTSQRDCRDHWEQPVTDGLRSLLAASRIAWGEEFFPS